MKNIFLLSILIFLSFSQESEFFATWNVLDTYNSEELNLKQVALRSVIKKKIVEQKSQIIFTQDSIMIKQNGAVSDRSKIRNLKKISKDSLTFDFDNHTGSFKLKTSKAGILTIDKKVIFQVERYK